jgi:putative ABC transport system permease protein
VSEIVRETRGSRPLDDLRADLRLGMRSLLRTPSFTLVVLGTLALGIGATSAIFTVIDNVLLRPAPVPGLDELVVVWETDHSSGTTREPASFPDYLDFRARTRTLAQLAAFRGQDVDYVPADGDPERLTAIAASPSFPAVLGIEPLLGRVFREDEDVPGAARVVLLGESFWRNRFGADPSVVGRTIRLNDEPHQVIGVLPAAADFGMLQIHARADYHATYAGGATVDAWLPLRTDATITPRSTHPFLLLGRLAPGARRAAAQAELSAIAAELEATYPVNAARGVNVEPLRAVVFDNVRPALLVLGGAVALVLLIACTNVTSLLLARSRARARETAVRTALGAGGGRLARQFLAENLLLAVLGSAAGLALAQIMLRVLLRLVPADVPRAAAIGINGRVLLLSVGIALATGGLFALVPLLHARRMAPERILRAEGGRGHSGSGGARFRSALVVGELALSVVLATSAVLLIRSFDQLSSVDPGFAARGVLKAEYQLPEARYPRDYAVWPRWVAIQSFNARVLERVSTLPGVEAAAIAEAHPLDPAFTNSFFVVGREAEAADWPEIRIRKVTPGYFDAVDVPVLRGRGITDADGPDDEPVVVINAAAAERFFAGREPIGAQVSFWGTPRTIVGVVGNERLHGLAEATPPALYAPLDQVPSPTGVLLVRTTGDPMALAGAVRAAVREQDPALALYGVEPLEETVAASIARERFTTLLLTMFAALAMVLSAIGVYGLLAFVVAQRKAELGIRLALGARPRALVGLVIGHAARLAFVGVALGIAGALAGGQLLRGLLYGVAATDARSLAIAAVAMLAVALLASLAPARRAVTGDPVQALRAD